MLLSIFCTHSKLLVPPNNLASYLEGGGKRELCLVNYIGTFFRSRGRSHKRAFPPFVLGRQQTLFGLIYPPLSFSSFDERGSSREWFVWYLFSFLFILRARTTAEQWKYSELHEKKIKAKKKAKACFIICLYQSNVTPMKSFDKKLIYIFKAIFILMYPGGLHFLISLPCDVTHK